MLIFGGQVSVAYSFLLYFLLYLLLFQKKQSSKTMFELGYGVCDYDCGGTHRSVQHGASFIIRKIFEIVSKHSC